MSRKLDQFKHAYILNLFPKFVDGMKEKIISIFSNFKFYGNEMTLEISEKI